MGAVKITSLASVGVASNGDGYIEIVTEDGAKHMLVFDPDLASGMVSAVSAASNQAAARRAARTGVKAAPTLIECSDLQTFENEADPSRCMVMLTTTAGTDLAFLVPRKSLAEINRGGKPRTGN